MRPFYFSDNYVIEHFFQLLSVLHLQNSIQNNMKSFLTSFTIHYNVILSPPSVCVSSTASDDWHRDLTLSIAKCPTLGTDIRETWFCLLNRYTYILKTCKSRHRFNSCTKFEKSTPSTPLFTKPNSLHIAFNGFLKRFHKCFRSEIRSKRNASRSLDGRKIIHLISHKIFNMMYLTQTISYYLL